MSDKRSQSEKFRRQRKNFFKRGTRIHQRCDAMIAVVVVRNGKLFLFDSSPDEDWLPGRDEWVCSALSPLSPLFPLTQQDHCL